ncbi:hypothetical protein NYO91_14210 [Arhodomonas aquaeolei]|uniref:hypothetical protein n=1 Tax=Arhodomonas aquaeolei TaxID=2369 RepID=UPI0021677918|nr:hypothetical protein [Arhodomonas aquaeolei]MCS4505234.1 hypothetical protein [Arhodomonas aquaeolei]
MSRGGRNHRISVSSDSAGREIVIVRPNHKRLPYLYGSKWLYAGFVAYWATVCLLPWRAIGRSDGVKVFVDVMASLIPSVVGLTNDVHFMPAPALEALLAFLHLSGWLFLGVMAFFLYPVAFRPNVKPSRLKLLGAIAVCGGVFIFFVALMHWSPGITRGDASDAFHDSLVKIAFVYVALYWMLGFLFGIWGGALISLFLPLRVEGDD